ncbi:16S rRNA (cytidine(1402)-2'-O)-methyltransferase [Microvirgula aerodenitrificans]|uniref:16S rRNA (cytidine(1402)-2'-O)-methyltransferase n=1 Tax=Microvirgula aerodenitrificans TaxID=57480 RepID=UPI001F1BCB6D|nr:16S rRNA (cytidine(1402)-2'-O)-methyltransferase [Microvirgula aerodenitrificans]
MLDDAKASFRRGTLYVAATPLGNLADITLRALAAFDAADIVLAEDTRVTGQLLTRYGIRTQLVSVREHNERGMADKVVGWLAEGKLIVQVSDAGTPAVSDPGARLARTVRDAGYAVSPLPGPSAVVAALSASGTQCDRWRFLGFLSPKRKARCDAIAAIADCRDAVVIYEAPHRLIECVTDLVDVLGAGRVIVLARELTKTFETIQRLPAAELAAFIAADPNQCRGEIALIIEPAAASEDEDDDTESRRLLEILLDEKLPVKQASQIVSRMTGANRKALYELALSIRAQDDDQD